MTNEMIILNERIRLLEEGVIKATGRMASYEDAEGVIHEYIEPEEIHTFNGWKSHGRVPMKGTEAVAKFPIWRFEPKHYDSSGEEQPEKMFLSTAAFFTKSQTEQL